MRKAIIVLLSLFTKKRPILCEKESRNVEYTASTGMKILRENTHIGIYKADLSTISINILGILALAL